MNLRLDCKPCEMHVMGRIKKSMQQQAKAEAKVSPVQFYRARPTQASS